LTKIEWCGSFVLEVKMNDIIFSTEQVKALCGGEFPKSGFAWEQVEHFELIDGVLQPFEGSEILPGPGIVVSVKLDYSN